MSDEKDTRVLCKYGAECYQKNPAHHAKYRHPKKRNHSPEKEPSKKQKPNETVEKTSEKIVENIRNDDTAISKEACARTVDDKIHDTDMVQLTDSTEKVHTLLDEQKQYIKRFFLVDMPKDFYAFWDFSKELNRDNPRQAFKSVGLFLVGAFDILAHEKIQNEDGDHLLHWRYYYDPPEFQTVLKVDSKDGYHIGYFRDSPTSEPVFVASNHANKDCIISPLGDNLFAALNVYLDSMLSTADPFKKLGITRLQSKLKAKARKLDLNLAKSTSGMQKRHRDIVCKSFHTAGIVVPYNRKTELGYRPLNVTEKELRKLLDRISKAPSDNRTEAFGAFQPVVTAAMIAIDECDFGTGLELGINLFCYGHESLNSTSLNMLTAAYAALDRGAFSEIAKAHLANRKKNEPHVVNYE